VAGLCSIEHRRTQKLLFDTAFAEVLGANEARCEEPVCCRLHVFADIRDRTSSSVKNHLEETGDLRRKGGIALF